MKSLNIILLIGLIVNSVACAKARPTSITPANFPSSPMCVKYKCKADKFYSKDGIYNYTIKDEIGNTIPIQISSNLNAKSRLVIYAPKGSLFTSPTLAVFDFFKMAASYYAGVNLDLKNDLLGSMSLVDKNKVDFFDLAEGKVGNTPVTIFEKSLPDESLNPRKGQLVYGIIDSSSYPPVR